MSDAINNVHSPRSRLENERLAERHMIAYYTTGVVEGYPTMWRNKANAQKSLLVP